MSDVVKTKNPKRVAAGKKSAEKRRAERAPKLKQDTSGDYNITKDDDDTSGASSKPTTEAPIEVNVYKNYIPMVIVVGIVGLGGLYVVSRKISVPVEKQAQTEPKVFRSSTPYDPFAD